MATGLFLEKGETHKRDLTWAPLLLLWWWRGRATGNVASRSWEQPPVDGPQDHNNQDLELWNTTWAWQVNSATVPEKQQGHPDFSLIRPWQRAQLHPAELLAHPDWYRYICVALNWVVCVSSCSCLNLLTEESNKDNLSPLPRQMCEDTYAVADTVLGWIRKRVRWFCYSRIKVVSYLTPGVRQKTLKSNNVLNILFPQLHLWETSLGCYQVSFNKTNIRPHNEQWPRRPHVICLYLQPFKFPSPQLLSTLVLYAG
jgi:hypothetical protein